MTPLRLLAAALCLAAAAPAATLDDCRTLRRHGRLAGARECFAGLASSSEPSLAAEGEWGLERYQQANDLFRAAVARHPGSAELRVRWGRLLLDRFNPSDASALFEEALQRDPNNADACVGLALVAAAAFDPHAVELARKAVSLDPKLVEARELLASLLLEDGDSAGAAQAADQALAISPDALDALAVHASIDWLKADLLNSIPPSPWIDRLLGINSVYGQGYAVAAHFFVLNRRYAEGIRLYEKAIALDPRLWSAHSQLGINLMRIGRDEEARAQLELSYTNGLRDNETVNSLRLLDSLKSFVTAQDGGASLVLDPKESDLLRPYFALIANRAMRAYEAKYGFKLNSSVRVEVYPNHEDFAVRTTGMPGLGALGVTFGTVVAMDSPSGRPPGQFHWASTLWHEMSHVYVLTETHHLVPRWFTEGLAVYEESIASPGWGDRLAPDDIAAIRGKKLLPVAELDRGFLRPEYPAQVAVSYFEAGQICEFIATRWSYSKLVAMIPPFGQRMATPDVIRTVLGIEPAEFDRRFLSWLSERTAAPVAHFDDWKKGVREMAALLAAHSYDAAIARGLAIRDFYSDYVETDSVYEMLATAYLAKADKPAAIAQLEAYARIGGRSPATLKQLATLEEEAGHPEKAIDALDRLNYIYPEDEDLHRRLGSLYLARADSPSAIREFQALLALHPLDQAGSHYELARALQQAHRSSEARDQVLLALEAAPDFKPAQKLLLELTH